MNQARDDRPVGRASRPTPPRSVDANPSFGYRELRRGRASIIGADYFLSICVQRPASGLADSSVAAELFAQADLLETTGCWSVRTAVIMPDHLHFVATLGCGNLSDAVRLFKGRTAGALRRAELRWQPSFFDHRLRSGDELPSIFRYVLLNPYRNGLLPFTTAWPAYRCCPGDWAWFGPTTNNGLPWPEWAGAVPPGPTPPPRTTESRA